MILYTLDEERNPFPNIFKNIVRVKNTADIKSDGVLILWGGADIYPGMYNEKPNRFVYTYRKTDRDIHEEMAIHHCIKKNIKMIGICRGAQLMCVVAGGTLMQHIEDHDTQHEVTLLDEDKVVIKCNSSHHQMQMPPNGAKILAVAGKTYGVNGDNNAVSIKTVPEVVWYPNIGALGIQPHPEWANSPKLFNNYCERKIKEYVL